MVEGKSYALCHAKYNTIDVQGTLAPKDLNWMHVTVTGSYLEPSSSEPTLGLHPTQQPLDSMASDGISVSILVQITNFLVAVYLILES